MVALYIVLGIILLIALILLLNVHLYYKLDGKKFTLYVRVGPVKIKLLPKRKKKLNYKKLAKKLRGRKISTIRFRQKPKSSDNSLDIKALLSDLQIDSMIEEISKASGNPELTKLLLNSAKDFALKFKTLLHTKIKHVYITVDEGDAAKTCIRCGVLNQAVAYVLEFFNIFTNMKPMSSSASVAVIPSFDNSGYAFRIEGSFRIRIISILSSFISSVFKSLAAQDRIKLNIQTRKDIKK